MCAQRSPYPFTEEDIEYLQQKVNEHAASFLRDVRQYKEQKGLSHIPDVYFSRKFMDELMVLLDQDNALPAALPSPKRRFTDIFNFKRKREVKHTEERQEKVGPRAEEVLPPQDQSDQTVVDSKEILLTGVMKVLDWSDVAKPKCIPCKLVLLIEMGVHKLEIYIPPKSTRPKTCIFCFLIDDVRPTTSLETPEMETRFVVKARNSTEYVFETEEQEVRSLWLDNLRQVISVAAVNQELGRQRPTSLSQPSAIDTQMRSSEVVNGAEQLVSSTTATPVGDSSPAKSAHNKQKRFSFAAFFGNKDDADDQMGQDDSLMVPSVRSRSKSAAADIKLKKGKVLSTGDISSGTGRRSPTHLTIPSPLTPNAALPPRQLREEYSSRKMSLPVSAPSLGPDSVRSTSMDRLSQSHSGLLNVPKRTSGGASNVFSHEDLSNNSTDLVDIRELVKGLDLQQLAKARSHESRQHQEMGRDGSHSDVSSTGAERRASFEFELTPSPTPPERRSPTQGNSGRGSPHEVPTLLTPAMSPTVDESLDPIAQLAREPWYHGLLLRSDCSRLLQSLGHEATGMFLVRKSESVNGEYVLSFNFQGRAKHLRMSVSPDGSCKMQHLAFSRVSEMLEYFKHNPIPLESTSIYGDIMLTDYVPSNESANVRVEYDAFQQARSNASLRGRAQSFTATSISDPPHMTLRVNGRPISRATENIYIRT